MLEQAWSNSTIATTRRAGASVAAAAATTTLFAATLLLGSGLIFTVEPMFAKMVLPRVGGSPAVWNTCVVFFQAAMLAGYAYAHLTTRWLPLRRQIALHGALVLLALAALPVAVPPDWAPPSDSTPIPWLLLTLTVGLGAPFLVLSATAPLLQKWFADTDHPSARDPYHLYAASNIGSLVALFAYPLVIEPYWTLGGQSSAWTVGYALYGALGLACAVVAVRRHAGTPSNRATTDVERHEAAAVTWTERGRWLALSLVPSSLLLGVTTYLSTDIAAVPLLWTLPLALYLLTFVMAFARKAIVSSRLVARAMPLLVAGLVVPMVAGASFSLLLIPAHLLAFFACALRLHMALASRRPGTQHLTEFYLWIAVGGVLGGLLNTLLAPAIFDSVFEYPAALAAACLLPAITQDAAERRLTRNDLLLPAAIGAGVIAVTLAARAQLVEARAFLALLGVVALVSFSFSRRPIRFGLAIAMALVVAQLFPATRDRVLIADRTFFGVLRVRADDTANRHMLMHGSTKHGQQDRDPARRGEPLSYYHRSGPIGQVMTGLASRLTNAEVGVVGLGAGSLAAYASPGQRWTFYEIDPAVARIARDPAMFTYLDACGDRCRIVLGDARLSLARTRQPVYQLLILDAFSSDAIPVHLMTREALDLYLERLAPDGIIAFHISNRHLRLEPVLAALAAQRGLAAVVQRDATTAATAADGHDSSEWLLLARNAAAFGPLAADTRWKQPRAEAGTRIWTDDFSDILGVLKTRD